MSAAVAAAIAAAAVSTRSNTSRGSSSRSVISINNQQSSLVLPVPPPPQPPAHLSRYESQKRRDWNTFGQYLRNHRPPLALARCSGANVLEFLRYLDQFGKTKVHNPNCLFFGQPHPPAPCPCPLKQAWGSLDALVGRLRAAFEENGGHPETNPFGARAVRLYLREVRDSQARARGIAYEKKKRSRKQQSAQLLLQQPKHHHQQMQTLGDQLQFSEVSSSNDVDHAQAQGGHAHGYPSEPNEGLMMLGSSDAQSSSMNMIPLYAIN